MAYNPETMSFELGANDVDMIYVSGLPPDATEAEIAEHFGSIGVVKFDKKQNKHKIWMYRDKMTGAPKGDCTVTYEGAPYTGWTRRRICMPRQSRNSHSVSCTGDILMFLLQIHSPPPLR